MKILEVFGEPISNGGQESFVFNLINHMEKTNLEIDALTPYYCDNSYYETMIKDNGGKIITLDVKFNPGGNRNTIKKPLNDFFQKNMYDVVHIHSGSISVLTIVAECAKKNGVKKVIVHSHCGIEKINIKNIILRNLASFSLRKNADVFCACSKIAGEAKFSKSVQNHVHIIKNGIDLKKFNNSRLLNNKIRSKLGISQKSFIIGHVGRFSYQKNHEFLVKVFYELQKKRNESILLLIGDGETRENVKKQIVDYNIEDKVIFLGNVHNVNEYMQAMDVFLLPSRFEGLPIVGVEAQASGLEIITSENVSKELEFTEHVHYLSLEQSPMEWAEVVDSYFGQEHYDCCKELTEHGYIMELTAKYVKNIYLN